MRSGAIAALVCVAALAATPALAAHGFFPWRIAKTQWSAADEAGFEHFITDLGNSDCSSSESCLRSPANPYRASDPTWFDVDLDCAKWPYFLRGYYAWKHGLPFSYVDALSGHAGDLRHDAHPNRPVGRHAILDHGGGIDGPAALYKLADTVFSASYRTDAADDRGVQSDFYSPAIDPQSIRPGTVIYDTNAHVGIVYKVDADGRIFYMDAHPDFTITRSVYGAQFGQSPARLGGGFKNWRPQRLAGAHRDGRGHLIGGRIVLAKNKQIADFSLTQYRGTEPGARKPRFAYAGVELGFFEYVRAAMSGGRTTYNPIYELRQTMRTICNDLKDRAQTVDLAISEGIQNKPHPRAAAGQHLRHRRRRMGELRHAGP